MKRLSLILEVLKVAKFKRFKIDGESEITNSMVEFAA